jgi:hypothetical protein
VRRATVRQLADRRKVVIVACIRWKLDKLLASEALAVLKTGYQRAGVRVDLTLWYSPEVKYIVKSIFKQGESAAWSAAPRLGFTSTVQLVRYTTAESRLANTTVLR